MKNAHKVDISSENVKNNERMNLTVANRVPICNGSFIGFNPHGNIMLSLSAFGTKR